MSYQALWERPLHQRARVQALASTSESVVVHERSTRLVGLDRQTGALRWDVSVGTWPRAVVVADDKCLVIAQDSPRLCCLNVWTGASLWDADLPPTTGHVVTTADTVLVGGWRGYTPLMAFDLATGTLRWETADRVHTVLPTPAGAGVLIGAPGSTVLRLIDPRTGTELSRWRLPEPLIGSDDRPALTPVGPERFLARCGSRSVIDLRLSAATVREFVRADADLVDTAVEYTAGLVWLRELRGAYLAVDPDDGGVRWRVDVRRPLVDQVVGTEAGFVLATNNGALLLVDSTGQVIERTVVAKRISGLRSAGATELLVQTKGTLLVVTMIEDDVLVGGSA